jgi:hypothetical protein
LLSFSFVTLDEPGFVVQDRAMKGIITARDVFRNLPLIGREFGIRCLFRCVRAVLSSQPTTFLELAVKPPPRGASSLRKN